LSNVVRVVLVDDHSLVRAGLRLLLEGLGGVEVLGEASNGEQALQLIEQTKPSIALVDIAMPDMTGLAVLREVRARHPETKVVLLSMYDNKEYVIDAIQSGAAGFLIKDAAVDELGMAIEAVERGDTYLSPRISRLLAEAYTRRTIQTEPEVLTARQTEVLCLVAQGHSSKEIARQLDLSIKTVETHRAQIMDRINVRDLAGLVRYAIRKGLVSDSD
jgi:DNA-binding NarL/FixJ family response regulator